MIKNDKDEIERILHLKDLYLLLPFGKTKINQMIQSNALPFLVKIGRDYIFTEDALHTWINKNQNREILY